MPPDDHFLTALPAVSAAVQPDTPPPQIDPKYPSAADWLAMLVRQGCQTLLLRTPRWERVSANPLMLVLLAVMLIISSIGVQRIGIDGPAHFYWKAVAGGWIDTITLAWVAYMVQGRHGATDRTTPGTAHLLTLMLMQSVLVGVFYALVTLLLHSGTAAPGTILASVGAGTWVVATLWVLAAQARLLLRCSLSVRRWLIAVAALSLGTFGASFVLPGQQYWYPVKVAEAEDTRQLHLSQKTIEAQQTVTAATFAALAPQRPGVIDVYALTFAPYAEESVFRRESAMLAEVLEKRFDAGGRTMQLVNHRDTSAQFPWATPWNLQRAIDRMALLMDRNEDILFIHVTSHGARDGVLSADFWPLEVDQITPTALRQWLDAAGVKYRVLSISACYAGAWIDPLASDTTLVMTASDATHTSYGCGNKSPLTFFGRAMYDEQLRNKTLSFEEAFTAAREVIRVREVEAGKDDGYSNPQIRMGNAMRIRLAQLQRELKSRTP